MVQMNGTHDAMTNFVDALLAGDKSAAEVWVVALVAAGETTERIVTEGIEQAMRQLDAKCTAEQFNLLEIMLTGRAVTAAMKHLFPAGRENSGGGPVVVVASLEGDVHDLGKNILKTVLSASGYRVIDCGKDCSVIRLVDHVLETHASAIGVSGLISSVVTQIRSLRPLLNEHNLEDVRIVAGGAALKQCTTDFLKVDYVAQNAFDGVRYLNALKEVSR